MLRRYAIRLTVDLDEASSRKDLGVGKRGYSYGSRGVIYSLILREGFYAANNRHMIVRLRSELSASCCFPSIDILRL